jgi:hypothetical protein
VGSRAPGFYKFFTNLLHQSDHSPSETVYSPFRQERRKEEGKKNKREKRKEKGNENVIAWRMLVGCPIVGTACCFARGGSAGRGKLGIHKDPCRVHEFR